MAGPESLCRGGLFSLTAAASDFLAAHGRTPKRPKGSVCRDLVGVASLANCVNGAPQVGNASPTRVRRPFDTDRPDAARQGQDSGFLWQQRRPARDAVVCSKQSRVRSRAASNKSARPSLDLTTGDHVPRCPAAGQLDPSPAASSCSLSRVSIVMRMQVPTEHFRSGVLALSFVSRQCVEVDKVTKVYRVGKNTPPGQQQETKSDEGAPARKQAQAKRCPFDVATVTGIADYARAVLRSVW
ncbi:hypothetical protein HPB47_026329 [Ixodes persulcatus]|uniref:Uncharacterized protein n=1 Tax=Ixodes persulcatus TaxID=34615 RepID=A0AC60Q0V2_IXOPE|nr:hypothetical protein HPB47_026329 [Ixodes persulcatus]